MVASERAAEPTDISASAVGYIDILDERRVAGWAWCRSRPDLALEVEFRLDGEVLRRVLADGFRKDLANVGAGDGRHAFNVTFDPPLPSFQRSQFEAFIVCGENGPFVPLVEWKAKAAANKPPAKDAPAAPASPLADLQPLLSALSAHQKKLDDQLGGSKAELKADAASAVQTTGDQLSALLSLTEVLQVRVDGVSATLQALGPAAASSQRGDSLLMMLVAGLGIVSSAALLLGLIAVFG